MRTHLSSARLSFFLFALALSLRPSQARAADLLDEIDSDLLPTVEEIHAWHVRKDKRGPTFAGSPSWLNFMSIVETELASRGVVDVIKDAYSYPRQTTSFYYDEGQWSLKIDDDDIPVASYWAYSGSTGPEGITAPLVLYETGTALNELEGKIAIFEVPALPDERPSMFQEPGYEFATDADTVTSNAALSSDQWYQTNYVTRFGRFDVIVKESRAAGALVVFSMGPGRAAGLYTFPLLNPGFIGAPGLYLDAAAGARVKQAARDGKSATMTLRDKVEQTEAYLYTGFLPGKDYGADDDEYVFVITHADGPNLTQDNGAFGVMSVVRYMSNIPRSERRRTLAVMIDSQHFMPHRHMTDWYGIHPDIVEKIVATIGIEHLGQRGICRARRRLRSVWSSGAHPRLRSGQRLFDRRSDRSGQTIRLEAHHGSVAAARGSGELVRHERHSGQTELSRIRHEHADERLLVDPRAPRLIRRQTIPQTTGSRRSPHGGAHASGP